MSGARLDAADGWEHRALALGTGSARAADEIAALAVAGWELKHLAPHHQTLTLVGYFRRLIPPASLLRAHDRDRA